MLRNRLRPVPLALIAMIGYSTAKAEYLSPDGDFRISGFGTLGAVRTTAKDAMFSYPGQGGGATQHASLHPDSKVAVQGTYSFTPVVLATAQVMTKYDAEGQYVPTINWAFAKWQATPTLSVRAGRMGAPFFMISDFRDVGYVSTIVRPPLDVYGQVPVSQFEGVDLSYQAEVGPSIITSTLWAGRSKSDYSAALIIPPNEVNLKKIVGLNVVADIGSGLTVRLGHMQTRLTVNSALSDQITAGASAPTLVGGLSILSPTTLSQMSQAIDLVNPDSVKATFSGVGVSYDQVNWVGSLEYTKRKTASYIADTTGWYAVLGYRIKSVTPYVGLSKLKDTRSDTNPVTPISTISPDLNDGVLQVSQGVDALLGSQKQNQKTLSVGARWDAAPGLALKAQFDHIKKPADSNGFFLNGNPVTPAGLNFTAEKQSINALTLSVDFVF